MKVWGCERGIRADWKVTWVFSSGWLGLAGCIDGALAKWL